MTDVYDLVELQTKREREKYERMVLPDEFWDARLDLHMIRDAARRRQVAPDAALGACLARVTAISDWQLRLPPVRGFPSPLSCWGVLSGSSAASKSSAMRVAAALLPTEPDWYRQTIASTGEAMIAAFWGEETNPETNKPETVRTHHAALVAYDEGSLLTQLTARQGSTLVQMLLTMWSGGTVGTDTIATAAKGKSRTLQQGTYQVSLLLAMQPEVAEGLLAQSGVGLVQRLTWYACHDLDPLRGHADYRIEPLHWQQPTIPDRRERAGEDGTLYLDVPLEVREAIRQEGADSLQPWHDADPLDGHANLVRLRVAAALALLDGRLDPTTGDWELAGMVTDVSRRIRTAVIETAQARATAKTDAAIEAHAAGIITAEEVREERIITNGYNTALSNLKRKGRMTKGALRNCLSTPQKAHFPEILHRLETDNAATFHEDGTVSAC